MSEWQRMESAPRDGRAIQARIPGWGSDAVISWWPIDHDSCGWQFASNQEPPEDWTDGVCWERNEDGVASTQPDGWKPLS